MGRILLAPVAILPHPHFGRILATAPRRATPRRRSAGAHTLDRQDRGDDDGDDDDYNDKRIMVDDGLPRYTGLTAKQRRMLL